MCVMISEYLYQCNALGVRHAEELRDEEPLDLEEIREPDPATVLQD